ncbi:Histone deacetylase 8 [Eumeta japonica]|uniref:Histone deacetylase 8 n=1 Tax=Eumeta variegata TaxID=151549 RepID=A0A4C1XUV0_EUMVA|nr:Histone deacetylase 8 [Eumeta japonica]
MENNPDRFSVIARSRKQVARPHASRARCDPPISARRSPSSLRSRSKIAISSKPAVRNFVPKFYAILRHDSVKRISTQSAIELVSGPTNVDSPRRALLLEPSERLTATPCVVRALELIHLLGGYNFPNAARLWTTLTAAAVGLTLSEDLPEHEYYERYAPDYSLKIDKSLCRDENDDAHLEECVRVIQERAKRTGRCANARTKNNTRCGLVRNISHKNNSGSESEPYVDHWTEVTRPGPLRRTPARRRA